MSMEYETRSNLAAFYKAIANYSGFPAGKFRGIEYIMNHSGSWPSYLLGGEKISSETMKEIAESVMKGELPSFWIRNLTSGEDFADKAAMYGIRQINYWMGMWMKRDAPFGRLSPDPDSHIERIMDERALREWSDTVNQEVMTGKEVDFRLFRKALFAPEFEFFRIVKGKKTIATILGFTDAGTVGLYMLSTKSDLRGKGYGTWMISEAIDYFITKGFRNFVLHGTAIGYAIYKKLGFRDNSHYGIFWMVGKF